MHIFNFEESSKCSNDNNNEKKTGKGNTQEQESALAKQVQREARVPSLSLSLFHSLTH